VFHILMSVELVAAYPGVLTGQSPVLPIPAGLGGWGSGQAVDLMQVAAGHAERGVLARLLVFPADPLAGHDASGMVEMTDMPVIGGNASDV
jgi:hypothetical protein